MQHDSVPLSPSAGYAAAAGSVRLQLLDWVSKDPR